MSVLRVSESSHFTLKELAKSEGRSMQSVFDAVIEAYQRKTFFEGLNADFYALRTREEDWQDELAERTVLEGTLMDGLKDE